MQNSFLKQIKGVGPDIYSKYLAGLLIAMLLILGIALAIGGTYAGESEAMAERELLPGFVELYVIDDSSEVDFADFDIQLLGEYYETLSFGWDFESFERREREEEEEAEAEEDEAYDENEEPLENEESTVPIVLAEDGENEASEEESDTAEELEAEEYEAYDESEASEDENEASEDESDIGETLANESATAPVVLAGLLANEAFTAPIVLAEDGEDEALEDEALEDRSYLSEALAMEEFEAYDENEALEYSAHVIDAPCGEREITIARRPGYTLVGWVAVYLDEYGDPDPNTSVFVSDPTEAGAYYTATLIATREGGVRVFAFFREDTGFQGIQPAIFGANETITAVTSVAQINTWITNAPAAPTQFIIQVSAHNELGGAIIVPANRNILIGTQDTNLATGVGPNTFELRRHTGPGRHFTVSGANTQLTLVNIILCGNPVVDEPAPSARGGIEASGGATVILNPNTTVRRNNAPAGGGVHLDSATLQMSAGTVSHNWAVNGGGIFVGPNATLITRNVPALPNQAVISNNTAEAPAGTSNHQGNGGGVHVTASGSITLNSGTTISGNTAIGALALPPVTGGHNTGNGGGIFTASSLTISDGIVISDNDAIRLNLSHDSGSGGGIYILGGSVSSTLVGDVKTGVVLRMTGGEITGNNAERLGGGVAVSTSVNNVNRGALFVMTGGTIHDNTASAPDAIPGERPAPNAPSGGGVAVARGTLVAAGSPASGGAAFEKSGGVIHSNDAQAHGGAVYIGGSGTVANHPQQRLFFVMAPGALLEYNNAPTAGAVSLRGYSHFAMSGGTIRANTGNWGGAMHLVANSHFLMTGGTIGGDTVVGDVFVDGNIGTASVIWNNNGRFDMQGGYILGNRANTSGLILNYPTTLANNGIHLSGGRIAYNTQLNNAAASGGGALRNRGRAVISGTVLIENNTATVHGGAILTYSHAGQDSTINPPPPEQVNGLWMTGGTIRGNVANSMQPAPVTLPAVPDVRGGGGVYVRGGGDFFMSGGTIGGTLPAHANRANHSTTMAAGEYLGGGGVAVSGIGSSFLMSDSAMIEGNISGSFGGGILVSHGDLTMTGGTIRANAANSLQGLPAGNLARGGGGVYITQNGEFIMTAGTIGGTLPAHANRANDSAAVAGGEYLGGGGVVVAAGSNFVMSGASRIEGNFSARHGGGILVQDATATIVPASTVQINRNQAFDGGGGAFVRGSNALFTMHSGEISHNLISTVGVTLTRPATARGGGVYLSTQASFILHNGEISENTIEVDQNNLGTLPPVVVLNRMEARGGGAVIYGGSSLTMLGGEISENEIAISGAAFDTISRTAYGGGVFMGEGAELIMEGNAAISDNEINFDDLPMGAGIGGGVAKFGTPGSPQATLIMRDNAAISDNTIHFPAGPFAFASIALGGGVHINYDTEFLMEDHASISGNTINMGSLAGTAWGGGLQLQGSGELIMRDNATVSDNSINAVESFFLAGGGVFMSGTPAAPTLLYMEDDSSISDNTITATMDGMAHGGGVAMLGDVGTLLTMNGGEISGNAVTAAITMGPFTLPTGEGGGIHMGHFNSVAVVMNDGEITNNTANGQGGGVWVGAVEANAFTATGGEITDNTAGLDGGGIFTVNHVYSHILRPNSGGGINWFNVYNNLNIANSVLFADNEAQTWSFPPAIPPPGSTNGQLPHVAWNPALGSSRQVSGAYLYLLNNDDINFRHPGVPFPFHKTNHHLYNQQNWANPGWLNSILLDGAHFNLYRWTGVGPAPDLVTNATVIPGGWVLVNTLGPAISSGVMNAPIEFSLTLDGLYHLVEVQAPVGFDLPFGQWRIEVDMTPAGFSFDIEARGDTTIPAFVYILAPCGNCTAPNCAEGVPSACANAEFIHFVGNRPTLVLPLMGGPGRDIYVFGGLFAMLLALGMLTYRIKHGRWITLAAIKEKL